LLDVPQHLVVDPRRLDDELAEVDDPVSDGIAADVERLDFRRLLAGDDVQFQARRAGIDD
jgi:hypothetical protein